MHPFGFFAISQTRLFGRLSWYLVSFRAAFKHFYARAVRQTASRKATGADEVLVELFKAGGESSPRCGQPSD